MRIATLRAAFAGALLLAAPTAGAQVLNEIMVSTPGTDSEFFEVVGVPATNLSTLTLIAIEGDVNSTPGVIDRVIPLTGSIPADGHWVAMSPEAATVYGLAGDMAIVANAFENSTLTILLVQGFTGTAGDDLDTNDDGTLDTTPWATLVDGLGIRDADAGDHLYHPTQIGPEGTNLPPGAARSPDAVGTWRFLEFGSPAATATPGAINPTVLANEGGPGADGLALSVGANPARGDVAVRFALPAAGAARLAVYDVTGREVAVLLDGGRAAGANTATLETGRLAPGVYVLRLTAGDAVGTRTVSVVR